MLLSLRTSRSLRRKSICYLCRWLIQANHFRSAKLSISNTPLLATKPLNKDILLLLFRANSRLISTSFLSWLSKPVNPKAVECFLNIITGSCFVSMSVSCSFPRMCIIRSFPFSTISLRNYIYRTSICFDRLFSPGVFIISIAPWLS